MCLAVLWGVFFLQEKTNSDKKESENTYVWEETRCFPDSITTLRSGRDTCSGETLATSFAKVD